MVYICIPLCSYHTRKVYICQLVYLFILIFLGHDNYMLYNNFDTQKKDADQNITAVIADFQRQIASRAKDPSISHYLKKYG